MLKKILTVRETTAGPGYNSGEIESDWKRKGQ